MVSTSSTTEPNSDSHRKKKPNLQNESRKIRKPLMEKKRRERINLCLKKLSTLVSKDSKYGNPDAAVNGRKSRLEKADILDMTVKYWSNFKNSKTFEEGQLFKEANDNIDLTSYVEHSEVNTESSYYYGYDYCIKLTNNLLVEYQKNDSSIDDTFRKELISSLTSNLESLECGKGDADSLRRSEHEENNGKMTILIPRKLPGGDYALIFNPEMEFDEMKLNEIPEERDPIENQGCYSFQNEKIWRPW